MDRIGAIPFRRIGSALQILVVTSKTRGRWVFPKGNIESGEDHRATCAREAYEEAGVDGIILTGHPIPAMISSSSGNESERLLVTFYPLSVENTYEQWPEMHDRQRQWIPLEDADDFLDTTEFANVIANLNGIAADLFEARL